MTLPNIETQRALDHLVDECRVIMAAADAARRDLTDDELGKVRANAAEFDRIRFGARARHLASKADLRDLLRDVGMAKAAAERVASAGWPALSPENQAAELAATLRAAAARFHE